jgi:hypothetical protein
MALRRTAVDTRHHERDEDNAESPSVGDTPQAPTTLEPNSPTTTGITAGRQVCSTLQATPRSKVVSASTEQKAGRHTSQQGRQVAGELLYKGSTQEAPPPRDR